MNDALIDLMGTTLKNSDKFTAIGQEALEWLDALNRSMMDSDEEESKKYLDAAVLHVGKDLQAGSVLLAVLPSFMDGIKKDRKLKKDPFFTIMLPSLLAAKLYKELKKLDEA